jgi:hypothetical protein
VQIFCELGEFDKVIQYANAMQAEYKPNYTEILRGVSNINPLWAQQFAIKIYHIPPEGSLLDIAEVIELFYQKDLIKV